MILYKYNGEVINIDTDSAGTIETPYLSASARNRLKEQSDFDMSSFGLIKTFTPFDTDYSADANNWRVMTMTQQQFYETFYDQYLGYHDDLLVTKKNLGKDQSGTYDIWCYDFIPYNAKRKICLSSGMHTYELPGSFGLARWIKDYMESSDAVFQYMRQNVQISLIPIINPWGFNQNPKRYPNVNGVNPNRNMNDWGDAWADFPNYSPNPSDPNYNEWNYKGTEPFSEAETKVVANWLKANTDAQFWIDCHTGADNKRAWSGDVWYLYVSGSPLATRIEAAADALMNHISTTYNVTAKRWSQVDHINNIKHRYGTYVLGIPTLTIEQACGDDTVYPTRPNNCPTAICEYATQIHAYVVAQLQV